MKLKYYLRGLGIGMLVAALVLVLSGNTGEKMSDEAVKRRAAQLGMVEKDKTVLGDIDKETTAEEEQTSAAKEPSGETPGGAEDVAAPTEPEEGAAGQAEIPEPGAGEGAPRQTGENTEPAGEEQTEADRAEAPAAAESQESEQARIEEIEQTAEEVADRAEEVAENAVTGRTVILEVRQGDSSISVARRAAEAGLVQSAADFDVFLCQNGYDKRISIGSYEIMEGASEKEIADAITKSR